MNETVRHDMLATISKALEILQIAEEKDIYELKNLSNTTIHNASIFQDQDSITLAVIIYSISKIYERTGSLDPKLKTHLEETKKFLIFNHEENFHKALRNTVMHISRLDHKLDLYIQEVIQQARIKKGSKIYEHGISMAQAADLLGISQWQLMDYVGKTTITDSTPQSIDVKKRLEYARGLFK